MSILGVDIGARRIAVASDTAQWEFDTGKKNTQRAEELEALYVETRRIFEACGATTVFVETPLMGRGGARVTTQLAQTQGIVLLAAHHLGARSYEVNVQTWKKAIVGKGNAKKSDVAEWAKENLAFLPADVSQDIIDATCIQRYGEQTMRIAQELEEPS